MAQARLIYKKISTSEDVNKLPLPARLLFTWMILQADDEGRMKGDPTFSKVSVVPYTNWSPKLIEKYLDQMNDIGLIWYFGQINQRYIEFPKWNEYQHIRKDRFVPSKLPTLFGNNDNLQETSGQPDDNQQAPQANINKIKLNKINKSEDNSYADKKSFSSAGEIIADSYPNPLTEYHPVNEKQTALWDIWKNLEPNNPAGFYRTFLPMLKQPIDAQQLYLFYREVKDDKTIRNQAAVFFTKVKGYVDEKVSTIGQQSSRLSSKRLK